VFPVRYELNPYILFRRNAVFKRLKAKGVVWLGHIRMDGTGVKKGGCEIF
jgi:hypothetical protein